MLKKLLGLVLMFFSVSPLVAQDSASEVQIRLVNLLPEFSNVKVWSDDDVIIPNVPYETFSPWLEVDPGNHEIRITDLQDNLLIGPVVLNFENGLTLVAIGTEVENNLTLLQFEESLDAPLMNQVRFNFFNAATDARFRLQTSEEVFADDILYSDPIITREFTFEPDKVVEFLNEDEAIFELTFPLPHQVYTLIAAEIEGEVKILVDTANHNAFFRVANFAPYAAEIDVFVGENRLPNIAYEQVTDFINMPAGTYELAVVPSGQELEKPLLPPQEVTISSVGNQTLMLAGQRENMFSEIVYFDPYDIAYNLDLLEGKNALVEVRHTIENAPPIDLVLADGTMFIEGLAFGQVGILDLPEGAYDFRITVSGEPDNILYERGATYLEGGKLHWMTLIGRYEEVVIGQQRLSLVSHCVATEGCE